jgi:hypothetical protein
MNKNKTNKRAAFWILGAVITLVSACLYFIKNPYWYYLGVIGIWILFDNLASSYNNKTTLDLLISKNYKKLSLIYILLFMLGLLIEVVGRIILGLWSYPLVSQLVANTLGIILYPFILMSFRETYQFVKSNLNNKTISGLVSMLIGIIVWEVPNLFSSDWVYNIPFVTFSLFKINIVVIVGWAILIVLPVCVYNLLDKN